MNCCHHLPGNLQCPYPALWIISFAVNEPRAYEKNPLKFRVIERQVCSAHLESAILTDLEHVPKTIGSVEVRLASPS